MERSDIATVLGELAERLAEEGFTRDVAAALSICNTVAARCGFSLFCRQGTERAAAPGAVGKFFAKRREEG